MENKTENKIENQFDITGWLNSAYHLNNEIRSLRSVLEENKRIATRSTANYENDGSSSSTKCNSTEDALIKIAALDEKIATLEKKLIVERDKILKAISSVDDSESRSILNDRHLAYKTMEKMAEERGCCTKTIKRHHIKAIKILSDNFENVLECPPQSVVSLE